MTAARRLLTAGTELLVADGWAALTHRRVADRAGVSLGLVRHHFGSVAGLRVAIAELAANPLIDALQLPQTTSRDGWVEVMMAGLTGPEQRRDDATVLLLLMTGSLHYPEITGAVRAALGRLRSRVADSLADLRPALADPDATAAVLVAALDGLLLTTLVDDPTDRVVRDRTGVTLRAVLDAG